MEIIYTPVFSAWWRKLKDQRGRDKILVALARWKTVGRIVGDIKPLGQGVSELRVHAGPAYRVLNFMQRGDAAVVLLIGGAKRRQHFDILRAQALADELRKES